MRNTEGCITIDKIEIAANLYTLNCMRTMMYITALAFVFLYGCFYYGCWGDGYLPYNIDCGNAGAMCGYYYGLCDANMLALTNTVKDNYIDPETGLLLFRDPNPNPWGTLPLYYVFPRALVLYAFVPVMKHITEVISNNAVREAELKKLSEMDSMTQLYNRNKYNDMLNNVYPKLDRVGVIFWDVNGLKKINDNMGHEYGGFAISAIAGSVLENLAENTRAYRVGGDEFVVIMEKAEEADLREMIRRTNDSINRKNKASKVFISAAFGFAIGSGKEIEKVITDADANMYAEKQRQKAERTE